MKCYFFSVKGKEADNKRDWKHGEIAFGLTEDLNG